MSTATLTWEREAPVAQDGSEDRAGAPEAELPEPVLTPQEAPPGAATLDAARDWLQRFVAWPSEDALNLCVLWAAAAHCTDRELVMVHAAFPSLIFTGLKNSGKTFAMEQVLSLCPRPDILGNTTAPSLAKQIATEHPTIGLDEMDLIVGNGNAQSDLRTLLNLRYKRSGAFRRVSGKLPVFCPLAMAGLASVLRGNSCLDTLRSRSIIIDMVPAEPGQVEKYRSRIHEPGAQAIAAALASWGEAFVGEVADAWPELPEGIANRDEEISTPILALAEVVGGEWPARAMSAVRALIMGESDADPMVAPAERILADVAAVWTGEQIGAGDLAARLACLKGSPWRVIFPDPARAGAELAEYLRPHGITPARVWLEDLGRHAQGYTADQFAEVLSAAEGEAE